MLRLLGASVRGRGPRYRIDPPRRSRIPRAFSVPGDASSAAYLWTAAAVSGGDVTVRGVPTDWPQADLKILRVLRASGTRISRTSDSVRAAGRAVRPVDVELTDAPDLVPLVGILAAGIAGRSRIRGAAHAIWKESDRRQGTARLVRELGGSIEVRPDQLVIDGTGTPTRIRRSASHDHRLVLSAAVAAVGADGESLVGRAEAVRKSYPGFWRDLRALGIRVRRFP
jgi:3-phosphoshikimate 1-carboxyvinyltransferase